MSNASSMESGAPSPGYLAQEDAAKVDEELMGELGFTLEQLMELAGQSVANAVYQAYATECSLLSRESSAAPARVLVVAGPGNNGGDGLVAARYIYIYLREMDVCVCVCVCVRFGVVCVSIYLVCFVSLSS
jgi:pyridoxal 5'-phosphate synthase / NAD(P)H-hydrate epimerase